LFPMKNARAMGGAVQGETGTNGTKHSHFVGLHTIEPLVLVRSLTALDFNRLSLHEHSAGHPLTNTERLKTSMLLKGKRGLIVGIANDQSIAYGCARSFHAQGAELAVTYLNAKAEPYVRPLAEKLECPIVLPCDVREPGQLEAVFSKLTSEWGSLDFLLHSIAFAPKEDLHSRLVDCSQAGFAMAMDVSCHSFIRMARLAEPLMPKGGCLLTVTFYGAEKVVSEYNLMGPVKSALESSVRYLAAELGSKHIRVHALSPGPIKTRAASGIDRFDELLERVRARTPEHQLVDIDDVGNCAAFLVSDGAKALTGNIEYIDRGFHVFS